MARRFVSPRGGKTTIRKFVSPAHAEQQYDKAVRTQLDLGFVLAPDEDERDPGEALIAPDDLDALAVHADALMDSGEVLGHVIATQLAIHRLGPSGDAAKLAELTTESSRLLDEHHEAIFGSFAPHARSVVVGSAGEPARRVACTASWRLGVIDEVTLAASSKLALAETIPALAQVSAARHLRSMIVGSSVPPSARGAPVAYDRFLVVLASHARAFSRLRSLFLGDLPKGRVADLVGALEPLCAAFPDLEVLRVRSDGAHFATLALPRLREIELVGRCASVVALQRIAATRSEHLVAVRAEQTVREDGLAEALEALCPLPRLERLGLRRWPGENCVASLLAFPRLDQLVELDLSYNALDGELEALVEHAHRFAHLETLDLRFNDFTQNRELFRELRARLPRANVAGQTSEHDRTERYDSIRE